MTLLQMFTAKIEIENCVLYILWYHYVIAETFCICKKYIGWINEWMEKKKRCRLTFSVNKFKKLHQYWHSNKFNYKLGNTISLPSNMVTGFRRAHHFPPPSYFLSLVYLLSIKTWSVALFIHMLALCMCACEILREKCWTSDWQLLLVLFCCCSTHIACSALHCSVYLNAESRNKYSLLILSVVSVFIHRCNHNSRK